jgi:predicted RNA-binding Zn ribbon-like protein
MEIDDIPLIAGHPALDFLNALEERARPAEVNYLPSYQHLLRWSARADLLSERTQRALTRAQADHPGKAKKVWAAAMDLRRALDAIFRTLAKGKPPPEDALHVLNATLAAAHAERGLQPQAGGALAWRWERPEALEIAAWEIALTAAALLTDQERCARIRICGNPACDWMFLDESRTGQRRWCRMNVCGNEAKVRRFRERQRTEQ